MLSYVVGFVVEVVSVEGPRLVRRSKATKTNEE